MYVGRRRTLRSLADSHHAAVGDGLTEGEPGPFGQGGDGGGHAASWAGASSVGCPVRVRKTSSRLGSWSQCGGRCIDVRGVGEAHAEHAAADLGLERGGRALGGDAAAVDHGDLLREAVRLIQVAHERRLAGAVGPEQPEHRARGDREIEAVQGGHVAEAPAQRADFDGGDHAALLRILMSP
jgi:hypothetical protein